MQDIQFTFPVGTVVQDRYVIERLLGKGGFGAVYLVRDQRVRNNLFALKELIDSSKQERLHFTFEGEVLKHVDHQALPRIYRVFSDDKNGRAYILMDYIEGQNLEMLRKQQPENRFSLSRVLLIMAPIVNAVSYLHNQQPPIIHRDIKPANIIVPDTGNGTVLVDFGIAKAYDPDSTTTAIRRFSPGYAAPEQYSKGTDTRTDIYALGAIIYTLLTGLVPADAFYRMTQVAGKDTDPLEPVNSLLPSLPLPVADAIHRAMAMHQEDRFPTVEQFWQAMNAAPVPTDLTPVPVIPLPVTPVPSAKPENPITTSQRVQLGTLRSRKRTLLLLLLAALLIGISTAAGIFAYGASHSVTNTPIPTHRPTVTIVPPTAKPVHTPVPPTSTLQPTATLQPTSPPTATPQPPTATPVPPTYPNVTGLHSGTIHNATGGGTANMSLAIQQNGANISGSFTVSPPLQGSGPFAGSVDTTKHISFTVHSPQVPSPLFFQGTVQPDGSMQGSYCSLDQANRCNPAAGGAGDWNVGPASGAANSLAAQGWVRERTVVRLG